MRRLLSWRTLLSGGVALTLAAQAGLTSGHAAGGVPLTSQVHQGGLSAAEMQRLSQHATQGVVIILRDQHGNLPARGVQAAARTAAIGTDQASILAELAQLNAPGVRAYHVINAIAATVSAAEAARLASLPQVQAVVPDRTIQGPKLPSREQLAPNPAARTHQAEPPCAFQPQIEPEAVQATHDLYNDPSKPQAQNLASGAGVTVAFIADGLDIHNPDFIRPDGTPVFTDYQDFSGDGVNAPTPGGEAFGDASSIAAQGNLVYHVNDYVNVAHQSVEDCPKIRIVGMAPGASLMGLKVFGETNQTTNSAFVQAIQYAVDHGANIINESFGGNPFPDNANDPISMADDAAVAAGITVVVSSGDAGTAGTIQSPSTDPNVIEVGATTTFRVYAQTVASGYQLGSGGHIDDNISSFSSAGISQLGNRTVDVVAPGDLGWALCSPDTSLYSDCTDYNGNPSQIEVFGGTSESSPVTAGEAALVIQAYRDSHGGALPSPALVKQIIMSTASDLQAPSYEQGAGKINAYRAVQMAMSISDGNGAPTPQGSGILVAPSSWSATDAPGTTETFPVTVTNTGTTAETIQVGMRTLGAPNWSASYVDTLDAATAPFFVDEVGRDRGYVEQDFTVPAGQTRLDAAISWDVVSQPGTLVRETLFDPKGRLAAFSIPQDQGPPYTQSGYGHVDVIKPMAGTWRAFLWTRSNTGGVTLGYSGPVHLDVSTSNFTSAGTVAPAGSPSSQLVAPGASATFWVTTHTPAQAGDESAKVQINEIDGTGFSQTVGAIPVVLRSLVPIDDNNGSFSGVLTGGNGRFGTPGQTLTYQFDVPSGLKDLSLGLSLADSNYNLEGILVDPDGLPIDVQSTVTSLDPNTFLPASYTNTMQFFRRTPEAGRWTFVLIINLNSSGAQTAEPFTANIAFNAVQVASSGVPSGTVAAGVTQTATVTVTNTGNTTKDFFVDPRLTQMTQLSANTFSSDQFSIPLQAGQAAPFFFVPTESTEFEVVAESSPTVPINMDIYNNDGAPPYGFTGSPDIEATAGIDSGTGNYDAVAESNAPEVVPGFWAAAPAQVGPFSDPVTPVTGTVDGMVTTQQFDLSAVPSSGDAIAALSGQPVGYSPLTLAPGQTGTITVAFTPSGSAGSMVSGNLYVDTLQIDSGTGALINGVGDELTAIPYSYTVK